MHPNKNLKMVLRVQKIEENLAAFYLVQMLAKTAQLGIQPAMVAYTPARMQKAMLMSTSNLIDPVLIDFVSFSVGGTCLVSGDSMKWNRGATMASPTASTINTSFCRYETMMGPNSEPIPQVPCDSDIQNPISYFGAAMSRHMLTVITKMFSNMPKIESTMHCTIFCLVLTMIRHNMAIPTAPTIHTA